MSRPFVSLPTPSPRHRRPGLSGGRLGLGTLLVALVGLFATGCGNSSSSSSASAGSSTYTKGLAYARCIRAHGVPNFPDPMQVSGGGITFNVPRGTIKFNAPTYLSAETACQSAAPPGIRAGSFFTPARKQAFLSFAHCMRSHGVPDFPDSTFANNTPGFDLKAHRINTKAPAFVTAATACRPQLANVGVIGGNG